MLRERSSVFSRSSHIHNFILVFAVFPSQNPVSAWQEPSVSCAFGPHEGVLLRLVSPRDRVVVATVAPCRSWGTLRVPLLAHTRAHCCCRPEVWAGLAAAPLKSSESLSLCSAFGIQAYVPPRLESFVCSTRLFQSASVSEVCRWWSASTSRPVTRQIERPVCVTCEAIMSFSMPLLSRH